MLVKDLMTGDPKTCRTGDSAEKALDHMDDRNCGSVPVVDGDGRVVGIVTDRDIVFGVRENGGTLEDLTVEACMTPDPVTITQDETAEEAVRTMGANHVRRAPVVDPKGKLVGILAQADIAAGIQDDRLVAHYLREISTAPPEEPAPER
ncbi:CBS domain-containing protein [soil metagenome]